MQPLRTKTLHPLTVQEYYASNVEDRTELIEGIVYDVSPRNEPHRYAVNQLNAALTPALVGRYQVQIQDAVAVEGWRGNSAPEIDVAVIDNRYYDPIPTAADAHAFIEVSDTSYVDDRRVKIPMYVRAGVPSWIINVSRRRAEAYADEADLTLPNGRVFSESQTLEILGVRIRVASLLGPA